MAFMCSASDLNPWISRLGPPATPIDDGQITIDPEVGGNFVGRHKKSSPIFNNIIGKCYEAPTGGVAHIRFIVSTLGQMHLYEGDFVSDKEIHGKRSALWDLAALPNEILADDEDWVATKT